MGGEKFVIASFRINPPVVIYAPKLTVIVVVIASALSERSTIETSLVDGAGACAHAGREAPRPYTSVLNRKFA